MPPAGRPSVHGFSGMCSKHASQILSVSESFCRLCCRKLAKVLPAALRLYVAWNLEEKETYARRIIRGAVSL